MYIVIIDFGRDGKKTYKFNELKSAKDVYDHAINWGLKVEVYKESANGDKEDILF